MSRSWLPALLLALGCTAAPEPAPPIVLVVIDTLRRHELPMYGGDASTPHLAALAERGDVREGLASFHQTSMSMGALFTGRTPSLESGDAAAPLDWAPVSWCGMGRFVRRIEPGVCLPAELPTLAEKLRGGGYHTLGVVSNALLHDPAGFSRGFDAWYEVGQLDPRGKRRPGKAAQSRTYEHVHRALREALDEPVEGPRFVYVHYSDVHDWLYRDLGYAESIELMDRGIGELLSILREAGLSDAHLVITADHGELTDDRKRVVPHLPLHLGNPSFRDVLDVPFLLVGDHDLSLPETVRTEDVHRVLLALAGIAGETQRDLEADELLVSERDFQTYQRGRFKSLQMRDGGFRLIDLETDPGETRDVADAHPEVARAHRERVAALTRELAAAHLETESSPIDPQWVERLRAMGYVE